MRDILKRIRENRLVNPKFLLALLVAILIILIFFNWGDFKEAFINGWNNQ